MPKVELSRDWECDGKVLKPKSGNNVMERSWKLENGLIRPFLGGKMSEHWKFDGKTLKADNGSNPFNKMSDIWELKGGTIKPIVESAGKEYQMNGHSILVFFGQVILKLW